MGGAYSMHGEKRYVCRVLVGKPEGHLKDLDVDGRIILEWILEEQESG
jgi:hypothetical protein